MQRSSGLYDLARLLGLLLLASCGPSLSDLGKHRPAAQAKLAAVGALSEVFKGIGRLHEDGFDVPGPPPQFGSGNACNAIAIASEDLADLSASKPGTLVPINPLENIACWCETGELSKKSHQYFGMSKDSTFRHFSIDLQSFLNVQYVLVLRTTRLVQPRMLGNTGFTGGSWQGEALLFEIEQKKFRGGMRFAASNSSTVEANASATAEYLQDDLRAQALEIVRKAFEARFPASEPPFRH